MLVFPFGVRKIISGADAAHGEMRDAHRLYNALVAVERWRRREYAAIRSRHVPGLSEVEEAYEQIQEWFGEHAGPAGERGAIRDKRKRASAPREKGGKAHPTKRVDVVEEIDAISELKRWRKDAAVLMRELRLQFDAFVGPAKEEYARRTKDSPPGDNWAKKRLVARVREEMLGENWHESWKDLARLEATAYALRAWVGDAHNLNHGTYTAVQDDVVQAGKRPRPRPDGEPQRPRQRPAFSSRGLRKMGWQIQGSVTWKNILEGKCRDVKVLSMTRRTPRSDTHSKPRTNLSREKGWLARMQIRISTADSKHPNWLTAEIAVHREVPDDAVIKWVYVVPSPRPGGKWKYSVQFTAAAKAPLIARPPGIGTVSVNLHWTKAWTEKGEETLEVARINGKPLVLPAGAVDRLRYAEKLRGHSDQHFDLARAETVKRLDSFPDEVRELCSGIHQWRAHWKLGRVSRVLCARLPGQLALDAWRAWRDHRLGAGLDLHAPLEEYAAFFGGDFQFALWLDCWRRKDLHLERAQDGTRRRAINRRRDFYRVTAADLARRFELCELGGAVDLATLALRDKSEDEPQELHQAARHNRQLAAVSELKQALKYIFGPARICERSGDEEITATARSEEIADDQSEISTSDRAAE